jgi:hypothetical protein
MFNLETYEWRRVADVLIPRFSHQVSYYQEKLWMFGGNDELE